MSTCPDCHGTGADAAKTSDARKRGHCDSRSYIRCWSCNGNGNDTAADFQNYRYPLDNVGERGTSSPAEADAIALRHLGQ